MYDANHRRPVSHEEFARLKDWLSTAEEGLRAQLEDAQDILRGWSGIADKAQYMQTLGPAMREVENLKLQLRSVYPVDDDVLAAQIPKRKQPTVDEILAEAWRNADVFRMEIWYDGKFVREVPHPDGPADPRAIAAYLRGLRTAGELRHIKGERGSPREEIVKVFPLEARPLLSGRTEPRMPPIQADPQVPEIREDSPKPSELSEGKSPNGVSEIGEVEVYFDGTSRRFCLRARRAVRRGSSYTIEPGSDPAIREVSKTFPTGIIDAASSEVACRPVFDEFFAILSADGWACLEARGTFWFSVRLVSSELAPHRSKSPSLESSRS